MKKYNLSYRVSDGYNSSTKIKQCTSIEQASKFAEILVDFYQTFPELLNKNLSNLDEVEIQVIEVVQLPNKE